MTARSASWFRPAEQAAPAALVAAGALFLFGLSWLGLQNGVFAQEQIRDTHVYARYGDAMVEGRIPYRDFGVEYPPGALPTFAVPALGNPSYGGFVDRFEALMALCGALAVLLCAAVLRSVGRAPPQMAAAMFFVALAPLALGSVVLSRFDLWPAALTVGALAALCAGRPRLAFGTLGLAVATKIFPGVLVPVFAAYVWRTRGRREAVTGLCVLAAVLGACLVPFVVVGAEGVWDAVVRQVTRPLQLESLGAAILLGAHHAFGVDVSVRSSHGSQNLEGSLPDVIAAGQTLVQLVLLVTVWILFARSSGSRDALIRASAASVCVFVAFGKVVSPQFLIWLIVLVPLVRGGRGVAAGALLAAALVLTQLWFPYRYWDLVFTLDETAAWLVLARDLVLVALVAVLVWPARPPARAVTVRG